MFSGLAYVAAALSGPALAQEDLELGPPPAASVAEPPEGSVSGMGDVNLYPKRVVIDRRQRVASIGLYNRTADKGDYEISILDMLMGPDGNLYRLDNLPDGANADRLQAASSMLRYSPRRVELRGNEAQTVRIMARPPADLPDGEYRAHFQVISKPRDADQGLSIDDAVNGLAASGQGIGVSIRPRFGIAIPVIVRVGETTLDVSLSEPRLVETDAGPAIALTINRSGTRSAFGDLIVTAPGSDEPVAIARGVGVYPEVDTRDVLLGIDADFDRTLLRSGTTLTVTYLDDDVTPGATLAMREFQVP
ncbi:fimbrial biogenesis chaperone [Aurantiacibacter spongiae]|uniref:Molecular chaperone n=1 Tax=Aurantiacibacter spongiae TaxID=2488860 RepID=A0A3N5CVA5_9SPHN|nr:hypothetical protein [Aurantiacibacter spongiae]RPF72276.1 hypothetical protein EG799_12060 [Aurantiacibacter spongiae]